MHRFLDENLCCRLSFLYRDYRERIPCLCVYTNQSHTDQMPYIPHIINELINIIKDLSLRSLCRLDPLTLNGSNYLIESVITFVLSTVESTLVESVDVTVVVVLLHAVNTLATNTAKIAFFIFIIFCLLKYTIFILPLLSLLLEQS